MEEENAFRSDELHKNEDTFLIQEDIVVEEEDGNKLESSQGSQDFQDSVFQGSQEVSLSQDISRLLCQSAAKRIELYYRRCMIPLRSESDLTQNASLAESQSDLTQNTSLAETESHIAAALAGDLSAQMEEVTSETDPVTYCQAMNSPYSKFWKAAMKEEWDSLIENHTWEDIDNLLQHNTHDIGSKWVFKPKFNLHKSIHFKARLIIIGYQQLQGINFLQTFAPVSKITTLRLLISIAGL
jgi:hypothetical protein